MTFEDRLRAALLRYIQQEVDQLAVEIVDWQDDYDNLDKCDTCGSIDLKFEVDYLTRDIKNGYPIKGREGLYRTYWIYDGGLGSLIRKLTDDDE